MLMKGLKLPRSKSEKGRQYNGQKEKRDKKDKQRSIKHYTEN